MTTQNYDVNVNIKANGADEATKKVAELNKEAEKASGRTGGLGKFADKVSETGSNLKDLASGELSAATSAIRTFAGAFSGAAGVMTGFAAAGVAVFAAVEGIGAQMAAAADDATEFADKLGVTTMKLEALKLIADENSGSVEGLQRVYDKLSKSMTKLDEDNEKTAYAFKVLGINAEEAGRMTETQLAGRIIGAYEDLDRSAKATAAVQQLLGGAFRDQIPAIKAAEEGMDDYLRRVREFGAEASPMLVQKGAEQETALSNLGLAWKGLKNQIAEFSTGIATDVANWAASVLKSISDVMRAWREGREQTSARGQSISPSRRMEIGRQATSEAPAGLSPADRRDFILQREAELLSQEQRSNFRRMEIGQYDSSVAAAAENQRIRDARAASAAVQPPSKDRGPKAPKASSRPEGIYGDLGTYEDIAAVDRIGAEERRKAREENERLEESNRRLAESYIQMADPLYKYGQELAKIGELRDKGLLTAQQAAAAESQIQAAMKKTIEASQEQSDQLKLGLEATRFVAGEISSAIGDAFTSGEFSFRSFLSTVLKGLAQLVFQLTVIKPLMDWFESSFKGGGWGGVIRSIGSALGFAKGGVFSGGSVQAFADGGIVGAPTLFPMSGGKTGLMGEAGPEAIMPLKRGADGKLGVVASGGGGGVSIGSISIVVQGGNTNEETAAALRNELLTTMKQVADGRIANARRSGGLLNPV